jgi:hypothetical protein
MLSDGLDAKAQRAGLVYRIFKKIKQPGRKTKIQSYKTNPKQAPYSNKNKKNVLRQKQTHLVDNATLQ